MALDYQADADAFSKQYDADQATKAAQAAQEKNQQPPSFLQQWGSTVSRVSGSMIDSAVSAADSMYETEPMRKARDAVAGGITGAVNMVDAAHSFVQSAVANAGRTNSDRIADAQDPANAAREANYDAVPSSPMWDHAKAAVLDFRDAVAVKDPTLSDNLTQGVAQLALPFAGFSRAVAGLHGLANMAVAGGLTDATALGPHDMRMADLIALGRHTEGKLGDALRALAPDGSAVNGYISYLADRGNESEAEGRFKNVLDGFGANLIATPLIHAAGMVLKQGMGGLRFLAENGVGSSGGMMGGPASQAGKIGWHGTPNAPFDAFDNSKIGSGQGAQSYGYGHYIAENAATGETYQKSLSGKMNNSAALSDAQSAVKLAGGDKVKAFQTLTDMAANEQDAGLRQRMLNSARIIKSGGADQGKGSLLKVDIADEHIDNMLDLDKPLEKQPEILNKIPMKDQKQLQAVLDDHGQDLELGDLTGNEFRQLVERAHNEGYMPPQGANDGNAPREAAEYLNSRGIPGNKYLDSKSRITGEGTRNYVVFDGKNIKVIKEPARPPLRQGYDPAERLLDEQVRRDADAAARNPNGKRPPLRQGNDSAAEIYQEQARRDVAARG